MIEDLDLEPAPEEFRLLFKGQALGHLDEIVLSWRMAGHPISWGQSLAKFEVNSKDGLLLLFQVCAPEQGIPAGLEFDPGRAIDIGMPSDFANRILDELVKVGNIEATEGVPIRVPLGKFSRGDRKVFLAYTLTIARLLACGL